MGKNPVLKIKNKIEINKILYKMNIKIIVTYKKSQKHSLKEDYL